MKRLLSVFIPFVVGIAFVGCDSTTHPTATVTGTAKSADGKPLAGCTIQFVHSNDRIPPGSAIVDKDGNYKVTAAPVGQCKVLISPPPKGDKDAQKDPTGSKMETYDWIDVPTDYMDKAKTELSFEVKTGSNTYPVLMKTKK